MKPVVSVIVPVYNEIELIENKIKNLLSQDYAGFLDIIIVDGGSSDMTHMAANRWEEMLWDGQGPKYDGRMLRVIVTGKGKTNQVNAGIKEVKGSIVLITDVDAIMDKDCISQILRFFSDEKVGVVGACSVPYKAKFLDPICWRISNFIRLLQSDLCTSPWVIATCYAFRRELISKFPDDVVADDAYIALYANFKGYHSVYTDYTVVKEVRNPSGWIQFFAHKHRKANALLREFTRFSYQLPYADPVWKTLFVLWFIFLIIVAGWSYPFYKQDSCFKKTK